MISKQTALILIGYQNDYFASDGILHEVIEESSQITGVLENTVDLIRRSPSSLLIISTPIAFTQNYSELVEPVGILQVIKEKGAFQVNTKGSQTVPELLQFGDQIMEVPGKRGLNAFSDTNLGNILQEHHITNVVIGGVVVSICIDSTARAATERGYKVSVLRDCTCGRTIFEQDFYCNNIFPIYAGVLDHHHFLQLLGSN